MMAITPILPPKTSQNVHSADYTDDNTPHTRAQGHGGLLSMTEQLSRFSRRLSGQDPAALAVISVQTPCPGAGAGPAGGEPFSTPNDHDAWQIAGKTGDEDGRAGRIWKNPSARNRRDESKHEVEIPNEPSDAAKVFDTVLNEEAGRVVREHIQWHSHALDNVTTPNKNKRAKKTDALNACFCDGVARLRARMKSMGTLKEVDDVHDMRARPRCSHCRSQLTISQSAMRATGRTSTGRSFAQPRRSCTSTPGWSVW